jgi:outer membrane lipoprotein-sorting protein
MKGQRGTHGSLIFFLLTLIFAFLASAREPCRSAADLPQAEWVLGQIEHRNKAINDISADLDMTVYAFLMRFPLQATLYFKKPNKVRIIFKNIPDFLKSYKSIFSALIPGETLRKNYRSSVLGRETIKGQEFYALKMIPRKKGNIKEIRLWVNAGSFAPSKFLFAYSEGGTVEVENAYALRDGLLLIERQKLTFNLPQLRGRGRASYHHYKINQGIDDRFFEKKVTPGADK